MYLWSANRLIFKPPTSNLRKLAWFYSHYPLKKAIIVCSNSTRSIRATKTNDSSKEISKEEDSQEEQQIQIWKPTETQIAWRVRKKTERQELLRQQEEEPVPQWTPQSIRLGALARKQGMTSLWNEWGVLIPCTVLKLENCQVIQNVIHHSDSRPPNTCDVQLGCTNNPKPQNMTLALRNHFMRAGIHPKRHVQNFRITPDARLPVGTEIVAAHFVPGQYVDIKGVSIGKGFAGVMKRWGFKGMPASHGTSGTHRHAGSTGQRTDPGKVFKGKKMAGRMGHDTCTTQNLQVVKIDNALNIIYVKGTIAGYAKQVVRITDAVKKWGDSKFPKDALPPPFPTIDPRVVASMPREIIYKSGGSDPLLKKDS
ncbi:hypothetical protein G9A89_023487 [Geosiphon pyriformis]|nr:hypothetical protein G9A89_023487 [Geosiphon pyriformis]